MRGVRLSCSSDIVSGCYFNEIGLPSNIIADETEPSYPCVRFHYASERALGVLGHRIRFIKNNNFVGRTWICLPVRSDSLRTGCLTCKVFDLFANDGDSSFV